MGYRVNEPSFGVLNYPHTGDVHQLCPYNCSEYHLLIKSKQTNTSEISIWTEVKERINFVSKAVELCDLALTISDLQKEEWWEASKEEYVSWNLVTGEPYFSI